MVNKKLLEMDFERLGKLTDVIIKVDRKIIKHLSKF